MKFKWMIVVVVALLAVPCGVQAESTEGPRGPEPQIMKRLLHKAISECKAEREATQSSRPGEERGEGRQNSEGRPNHEARKAFRACVKEKLQALRAQLKAAHEECKAERKADPVAFREKYGRGERPRGAFRRCVIQHVKESATL